MPPRKPSPKQIEKAELKREGSITLTVQASEATLQRIAALLMFAEQLEPVLVIEEKPLPWDDPNDPRFNQPPSLEIIPEVVRRDILKLIETHIDRKEECRAIIKDHGADRISAVPEHRLLDLYHALNDRLNPRPTA